MPMSSQPRQKQRLEAASQAAPSASDARAAGLGAFAALPDAVVCYITFHLDPKSILQLSSASKLLRIFCCHEPLWLFHALQSYEGPLTYRGSWRATALNVIKFHGADNDGAAVPSCGPPAPVPGFDSQFLNKRWRRINMQLADFTPPQQHVQRMDAAGMTPDEFRLQYDQPCRPVALQGIMDLWPSAEWTPQSLAAK